MFAGKKSAQIREILISESAWEEMTCLFAPSLGEGRTIFEIFALLNLHLKTIYQARQNLIKKLGCSGLIDFQGILRAQIFRNWLEHA